MRRGSERISLRYPLGIAKAVLILLLKFYAHQRSSPRALKNPFLLKKICFKISLLKTLNFATIKQLKVVSGIMFWKLKNIKKIIVEPTFAFKPMKKISKKNNF